MRSLIFCLLLFIAVDLSAQNLKSGGVLKPEQANMDIRHYTIALDVDPQQKSINGYTEIDFNLIRPSNYLLLDFWHGLTISQLLVNGKKENFEHTNDDYIKIHLASELPAGKVKVKVVYGGNPYIAERHHGPADFNLKKILSAIHGSRSPARVKEQKFISHAKIIQATNRMKVRI